MTAPTDFKPGDRVVCIGSYMHRGDFGVVVERGDLDSDLTVPVQFDGAASVYRALTPYDLRKMPPAWQPKGAAAYRNALRKDDGSLDLSARTIFATREEAQEEASRDAIHWRGVTQVVCAIVPMTEVVAPKLIAPPVEVKEL